MARTGSWVLFVGLGIVTSACAHGPKAAPVSPRAALGGPEDTVSRLIATADAHLGAGVAQSKAGHLRRAREEFDRALDTYLNVPGGAVANPRLAEAYRRTLQAVQLQEFEALAAGDGFTETLPEPASIDEIANLEVGGTSPSEEVRRLAQEVVRGEYNDLPITLNDAVLGCIELYQGPLREWFASALERGGRFLPRIRQVFAAEGIPQDLAYVALVESAFKTGALSRAKAKGVWQFMPATGRRFGLQQDWWVDERSNPEKSTQAAAEYLKLLHGLFQDWNLALAAYNAGEGRILRVLDSAGIADFWELSRTRYLPRETRNYVPMIHAAIVVAKAPDKYGFQVEAEPALSFDAVPVKGAVDLRLVAECSGTTLYDVQTLNPELRRLATPAGRTFQVKVPAGSGERLRTCLAAVPGDRRVTFRTHVVARGQTLSGLARKYGTSAREIAAANGLSTSRPLARGAELIIPVSPKAAAAVTAPQPPAAAVAPAPAGDDGAADQGVRISYRVQAGDTLHAIASRYKTTVRALLSWNKGIRAERLATGHTLTVYTGSKLN